MLNIIDPGRLAQLGTVTLDLGPHSSFDEGHCALEIVAWLAGESHTDAPECVSLVLRRFMIQLNDTCGDVQRQKLKPFLPRLVGTADDGHDEEREYLALDWLVRTYTPAWLDLAGLTDNAAELRGLDPIVNKATADAATAQADAALAAAQAARDAASPAAQAAAEDAARAAVWGAAGDAAGSAAWAPHRDADRDAARAAARTAGWAAARNVALSAGTSPAAWAALQPTVETLQASSLDLLDRMLQVGETQNSSAP